MSGLGVVGTAARGAGTAAGVGVADASATRGARERASEPSRRDEPSRQRRLRKEHLLVSLLRSVERKSAEDESYPDVGEEGRRHFFASCDPGDLRVGDVRDALAAYRARSPRKVWGCPRACRG